MAALASALDEQSDIFIFRNKFVRPVDIDPTAFKRSVNATKAGIARNPYNHFKKGDLGWAECRHELVEGWKLNQCAGCKKDLGALRLQKEKDIESSNIAKDEKDLKDHGGDHMEYIHKLGVNVKWLLAFTFDHDCWEWPTWRVNRDIIKPATRNFGYCRYSELEDVSDFTGSATVFMSHCWGAKWGELVLAACEGARSDRYVWIDCFAVRQWPGNTADLDFRGVVDRCEAMLVAVSPLKDLKDEFLATKSRADAFLSSDAGKTAKTDLFVFRLWCVVEVAAAVDRKKPIVVKGGAAKRCDFQGNAQYKYDVDGLGFMFQSLSNMVDVESSECYDRRDYDREMAIIKRIPGGTPRINRLVSGVIDGAVLSQIGSVLEVDSAVCGEFDLLSRLDVEHNIETFTKVLLAAATGGRVKVIRHMLDRLGTSDSFIHANLKDIINSSRALYFAAKGGHINVIKLLFGELSGGLDVNAGTDENNRTPLWLACHRGHIDVVKFLINHGADANAVDAAGCGPLFEACQYGHLETVQALLNIAHLEVNATDLVDGSTPLLMACQNGHRECVKTMIKDSRVDVNIANINGRTPIFIASKYDHPDVVAALLTSDTIDIGKTNDRDGCFPLSIASQKGLAQVVDLLLDDQRVNINQTRLDDETTALYMACHYKRTEIIKRLVVAKGIDLNRCNMNGISPLWISCAYGNVDGAKILIQQPGIDLNVPTQWGTAYEMAKKQGHVELSEMLLQRGARKDVPPLPPRVMLQQQLSRGNETGKTNKTCSQGHALSRFKTWGSQFGCDICSKNIGPSGSIAFGCDICNFDMCVACEQNY